MQWLRSHQLLALCTHGSFLYLPPDPFTGCLQLTVKLHGCASTSVGECTFIIIILLTPFIIIKYVSIKGMDSPAAPTSSLSILTDKNLLSQGVALIKDGILWPYEVLSCPPGFCRSPFTCMAAPSQGSLEVWITGLCSSLRSIFFTVRVHLVVEM